MPPHDRTDTRHENEQSLRNEAEQTAGMGQQSAQQVAGAKPQAPQARSQQETSGSAKEKPGTGSVDCVCNLDS